MERSRAPWLVGLPLLVAGWLSAHGLAYELAPPGGRTEAALTATGHAYLDRVPLVVALLAAVAAAGVALRIASRRPGGSSLPAWLFGAVPFAGFAAQEHLERLLHGSEAVWTTATEPVFLLGLLLQIPLGLAAALVARALLAAADALVTAVRPPRPRPAPPPGAVPAGALLTPRPALAGQHAGRAPPPAR